MRERVIYLMVWTSGSKCTFNTPSHLPQVTRNSGASRWQPGDTKRLGYTAKSTSLVLTHPSFPCSQLTLEVEVSERGVDGVQVSTKVSIW